MSGVVDEGSSKPASASPTGLVVVGDLIGEGSVQEQSVVGETPNLPAGLQALAALDAVVIAGQPRSSETASANATGWRNRKFADSPLHAYRRPAGYGIAGIGRLEPNSDQAGRAPRWCLLEAR